MNKIDLKILTNDELIRLKEDCVNELDRRKEIEVKMILVSYRETSESYFKPIGNYSCKATIDWPDCIADAFEIRASYLGPSGYVHSYTIRRDLTGVFDAWGIVPELREFVKKQFGCTIEEIKVEGRQPSKEWKIAYRCNDGRLLLVSDALIGQIPAGHKVEIKGSFANLLKKSNGVNIHELPIGTAFYVVNGDWQGEIIEKDGLKYIMICVEEGGSKMYREVLLLDGTNTPSLLDIRIITDGTDEKGNEIRKGD